MTPRQAGRTVELAVRPLHGSDVFHLREEQRGRPAHTLKVAVLAPGHRAPRPRRAGPLGRQHAARPRALPLAADHRPGPPRSSRLGRGRGRGRPGRAPHAVRAGPRDCARRAPRRPGRGRAAPTPSPLAPVGGRRSDRRPGRAGPPDAPRPRGRRGERPDLGGAVRRHRPRRGTGPRPRSGARPGRRGPAPRSVAAGPPGAPGPPAGPRRRREGPAGGIGPDGDVLRRPAAGLQPVALDVPDLRLRHPSPGRPRAGPHGARGNGQRRLRRPVRRCPAGLPPGARWPARGVADRHHAGRPRPSGPPVRQRHDDLVRATRHRRGRPAGPLRRRPRQPRCGPEPAGTGSQRSCTTCRSTRGCTT